VSADYSEILERRHPLVKWSGSGATYDRIEWIDPPISKADLDALRPAVEFEIALGDAYVRLIAGYENVSSQGFSSSALGEPHWYSAKMENQVDLIGALVTSQIDSDFTFPFPCVDLYTTPPQQKIELHDDKQIADVMKDGAKYKVSLFAALESQLAALPTMTTAQLEAVTYAKP